MIDAHSLQVGDLCRWENPRDHPFLRGLFVVVKITFDLVWYEMKGGERAGERFCNNGFQSIILIREAGPCVSTE